MKVAEIIIIVLLLINILNVQAQTSAADSLLLFLKQHHLAIEDNKERWSNFFASLSLFTIGIAISNLKQAIEPNIVTKEKYIAKTE